MKKILFLSPLPPPNYGSALSSKICSEILQSEKNIKINVVKLNYSKKIDDIGQINLNKIKGIFYVVRQIKSLIKKFKPDLVYFVPATSGLGLRRDYWFFKILRKRYPGKILFHIRSRINTEDKNRYKKIYSKMFKDNRVIVLGEELASDVENFVKKEDIFILPNAIENFISDKSFKKIKKDRSENKVPRILFLSNMDRTKGWPKVLEACKILNEEKINFVCNFVGAWQKREDEIFFDNYVRKNKLSKKVFYLGQKNGFDKENILEYSDILVFPTKYKFETFGRVIIEGMCAGIPVIASNIATIPSTISDGKTGFLLKENTSIEISTLLKKLIQSRKTRLKMGDEGRKKFLKEFEINGYRKKFLKIINSI